FSFLKNQGATIIASNDSSFSYLQRQPSAARSPQTTGVATPTAVKVIPELWNLLENRCEKRLQ
ncbi:MAG: hypothetical protein AAFO01_08080, partial [Pseudomonadota bacterium]